jgi:hypothetical protein
MGSAAAGDELDVQFLAGVVDVLALAESAVLSMSGWKLDTGATQHISNTTSGYKDFVSYAAPKLLLVGKAGVTLAALGEGVIVLRLPTSGDQLGVVTDFTMTKVWYCPDCPFQLISSRRIVQSGHTIQLDDIGATILSSSGETSVWLGMDASGLYSCLPDAQLDGCTTADGVAGSVTDGIGAPHEVHACGLCNCSAFIVT